MKSRFLGILSLIILSFALAACDGSSSSSSGSAGGAVAAAPLKEANVYGYTAEGAAILIGTTSDDGSIAFNSSLSSVKFPSVVYSEGGKNYKSDAAFAGTLKGVMESATSQVYLTPANTLVAELYGKSLQRGVDPAEALADAKTVVENIVKKDMGLTTADPFANPLSDKSSSEFLAKSLMTVMGLGAENDASSMENFGYAFAEAAESLSKGKTFTEVAKAHGAAIGSGKSLADFITQKKDSIVDLAADALGYTPAEKAALGSAIAIDNSEQLTAITFTETPSNEPLPIAEKKGANGALFSVTFTVKALSNKTADAAGTPGVIAGAVYELVSTSLGTVKQGGSAVNVGDTGPATGSFTFEVAAEDVVAGNVATFTIASEAYPNIKRTYTVTFISDDAFAIEEMDFEGAGLYEVGSPTAEGKIAKDETRVIGTDEFKASLELVNAIADINDVNANVDVRFSAPEGFKFSFDASANQDAYTVTDVVVNGSADKYLATVPNGVLTLVAQKDLAPGFRDLKVQAIDPNGNQLASVSQPVIFVPENMKDNVTSIVLGDSTINSDKGNFISITSVNSDGVYVPTEGGASKTTSLVLEGSYSTWNSIAEDGNVASPDLSGKGKFYLVSDSGKNVLATDATGTGLNYNRDITSEVVFAPVSSDAADAAKKYRFTAEIVGQLFYKPATGVTQDTLRLVYIPDPDSTPADPIKGSPVTSMGGLTLDITN